MPISSWFVRLDSNSANNASINVKPDASFEILFASDGDADGIPDITDDSDNDGSPDENDPDATRGDLVLQQPSTNANTLLADPNTLISVDGGNTWETFVFIQSGDVPSNKSPAGKELFLIRTTSSNLRLVGISDDPTRSSADSISNGGINIINPNRDDQPVCFTAGTLIETPLGCVPVERLRAGDLVMTKDHGPQPLVWTGQKRMAATPQHAPIHIQCNALGAHDELFVSPQHRILISHWGAELAFGESEVLVAAKHLVNGETIRQLEAGPVVYVHIMFANHEIVFANGLSTESFFVGDQALSTFDAAAREEIISVFGELAEFGGKKEGAVAARKILKAWEGKVARRFYSTLGRPLPLPYDETCTEKLNS